MGNVNFKIVSVAFQLSLFTAISALSCAYVRNPSVLEIRPSSARNGFTEEKEAADCRDRTDDQRFTNQ
jgi:hypothetical protein